MLIVNEVTHEEMKAVWASSGLALLRALGFSETGMDAAKTEFAAHADIDQQPDNVIRMLKFVAEQRLSARATRRRRGVKNDTRKQKAVTT